MTLVTDESAIQELQQDWEGARLMLRRMGRHVRGASIGIYQPGLAESVYSLPLLLACDVLEQVLLKAKMHYGFKSQGSSLGRLIEGARSESAITWRDYAALQTAIAHRNAIAHDGELFASEICLSDMAAIERQLLAWDILNEDAANLDDAINDG